MTKDRILIITSTFPRWSGDSTPQFVQHLAKTLSDGQYHIDVLAPHSKGAASREKTSWGRIYRFRYFIPTSLQNIAYDGGGAGKVQKNPLYMLKLLCFIISLFLHTLWLALVRKSDVINAHWVIPQGFIAVVAAKLTRKKVIITVHGSDVFTLNQRPFRWAKRLAFKHSDEVCVNSQATKKQCQGIYNRDYQVIPMGIHLESFPAKKAKSKKHNKKLNILYVGRFSKIKGVDTLLDAARQLKSRQTAFHITLVGDGELDESYRQYVKDHGLQKFITFAGWVDYEKLHKYYDAADVFVGPSLSEAQGLVFVEALATGTPVVATRVGGIPDVVVDGKNGYLIEPGDSSGLKDVLSDLIDHPSRLEVMRKEARLGVLEKFDWPVVASQYSKVLTEVLSS